MSRAQHGWRRRRRRGGRGGDDGAVSCRYVRDRPSGGMRPAELVWMGVGKGAKGVEYVTRRRTRCNVGSAAQRRPPRPTSPGSSSGRDAHHETTRRSVHAIAPPTHISQQASRPHVGASRRVWCLAPWRERHRPHAATIGQLRRASSRWAYLIRSPSMSPHNHCPPPSSLCTLPTVS